MAKVETFLPEDHKVYRYVIIDDMIESGETISQIRQAMTETYDHIRCVGIILYQNDWDCKQKFHYKIPVTVLSEDIVELACLEDHSLPVEKTKARMSP